MRLGCVSMLMVVPLAYAVPSVPWDKVLALLVAGMGFGAVLTVWASGDHAPDPYEGGYDAVPPGSGGTNAPPPQCEGGDDD